MIGAEAHQAFFEASDEELDQAPVYKFMTPIFGKGIVFDTPLKRRRQQMRALGRSLRPSIMKTYPATIAAETRDFLQSHIGDGATVDLHKIFAQLVINTASATLLGPEVRGEMFDEMAHLYEMLDEGLQPISIFLPYLPTASHAKRDKARIGIAKLFGKIIQKRRDDPEASSNNNDVVQSLMGFTYKDGTQLTDDEITGMIIATLFAGQHTSSIVSTWSTLFLVDDAQNKGGKWMAKVMAELNELEPEAGAFARGTGLDGATVQKEVELYKVVKETIRMHPPLIMLMRRVMKPIVMPDGTCVPVGHRAVVSNAIAQRLPEVFENPDEWDPSRWDEFNIAKLPKYSFIGFGSGLHTCMGEPFAFMQVRTIMSVLLSMYDLEMLGDFPEPDFTAMVVPPKGPNMVKFTLKKQPPAGTGAKKATLPKAVPASKPAPTPTPTPTPASDEAKPVEAVVVDEDEDEDTATFTAAEVAKHNSKESLWVIVKGKVYDVTNFLDLHQGGDEAIVKWGGKDATEAVYGPQHPNTVQTLIERYRIGSLKN